MQLAPWKMFLDDLRHPPDRSWVVIRSVRAAKEYIEQYGVPMVMSFDHDLGDGVDAPVLVHWLIDRHLDGAFTHEYSQIKFGVHSANPIGRQNLIGLWDGYLKSINSGA